MANVIVTLKIMPSSPEVDLDVLYTESCKKVRAFIDTKHKDDEVRKIIEPVGFGLKALKLMFVMDENIGTTDKLEEDIKNLKGAESVQVTDVRRAIG